LFIIYINDLPDVCKQFINVYLFADDAKLYKHVITDDDHQVLQKGLNTFQEWSDRWLNIDKCKIAFMEEMLIMSTNIICHLQLWKVSM